MEARPPPKDVASETDPGKGNTDVLMQLSQKVNAAVGRVQASLKQATQMTRNRYEADRREWVDSLHRAEVHRGIDHRRVTGRITTLEKRLRTLEQEVMQEQQNSLKTLDAILVRAKSKKDRIGSNAY